MNAAGDTNQIGASGERAGLDPREAARILEQAKRQARRQFDPVSPLAAVAGAGAFLVGYGAVWWSMRDQQVYGTGPALWSLAAFYGAMAVGGIVVGAVSNRATAGGSAAPTAGPAAPPLGSAATICPR